MSFELQVCEQGVHRRCVWCGFLFTCINSGSHKVSITLIFRYSFIAKMRHTVLDNTQSVLRDMTSQEHCRHPQGMNFKDITKDTTQDMILDMIRYVKKLPRLLWAWGGRKIDNYNTPNATEWGSGWAF